MAVLFVLGNGFDRHLGLPTEFADFGKFVAEKSDEVGFLVEWLHGLGDLSDRTGKDVDAARHIFWSEIETRLARLNVDEPFANAHENFERLDSREYFNTEYWPYVQGTMEEELAIIQVELPILLSDWVHQIDTGAAYMKQMEKFGAAHSESAFVSFNYTTVLQDVWDFSDEKIYHIHGKCGGSDKLVIGHGETQNTNIPPIPRVGSGYVDDYDTIRPLAEAHFKHFRKPSERLWGSVEDFLAGRNVHEIFVLGHSFGKPDWYYFFQLAKRFPRAVWAASVYSDGDKARVEEFADQLKDDGFSIKTGSIDDLIDMSILSATSAPN
ncbi:bacteriophage abortive infection AbiH family protein [Celeribacter sp.]|uniref:bacteriophage abortive infection AbiH family protein n=1 Tax=Celeribacter sp. TaxID=1890673 RepID=UPI003A912D92